MRILVPLMTDFEEIEAVTVIDILRRAGVQVVTAGLSPNPVMGAHGIPLLADASLDDVDPAGCDGIVLPGGKGTERLRQDPRVARAVREIHARGGVTAAICAAPIVLSDLGLLVHRQATSHPGRAGEIACGQYLERPVVGDDSVFTSRGAGTAMAFALALVARLAGGERAREIARAVLADWEPE